MLESLLTVILLTYAGFAVLFLFLWLRRPSAFLKLFGLAWCLEAARTALLMGDSLGIPWVSFRYLLFDLAYVPVTCLLVHASSRFLGKELFPSWPRWYLGISLPAVLGIHWVLKGVLTGALGWEPEEALFWKVLVNLVVLFIPGAAARLLVSAWFASYWKRFRFPGALILSASFLLHGAGSGLLPFEWVWFRGELLGTDLFWFLQVLGLSVGAVILEFNRQDAELVEAQEKAQQSARQLSSVLDTVGEGIVAADADGRIRLVNQETERIWGYSAGELLGQPLSVLVAEKWRSELAELASHPDTVAPRWLGRWREIQGVRADGSSFSLEIHLSRTPGNEEVLYTAALRDISQRLAREEEKSRLEAELRHSQKMEAVGRMAAGIAHDFNNILTAILGYSELLVEHCVDEEMREQVNEIRRAAARAGSLTSQLVAFCRKQVNLPQVVDLNGVIWEVEEMLARLIGEDVQLITRTRSTGCANVDPDQVSQILMNLAVNARDAMPEGGELIIETEDVDLAEASLRGSVPVPAGAYVALTVRDTGHGIDPKIQERIFEPFFTTKDPGKGSGLGLSTVYGIVQQNGGYILVESQPGKGTSFRILFPRISSDGLPVEEPEEAVPSTGGSETILLVEDEPSIRCLLRDILKARGYRVLEAEDGTEALRVAEREKGAIDLLITDVVMPQMGGRKLVECFQERNYTIRVIFISGYVDDPRVREEVSRLNSLFLQKPFNPRTLLNKVVQVLGSESS